MAAPIDVDQRIHTLDILRGLALFGMILVHFHQNMRGVLEQPKRHLRLIKGWMIFGASSWALSWVMTLAVRPRLPQTSNPDLQSPLLQAFGLLLDVLASGSCGRTSMFLPPCCSSVPRLP
jgi:hypothetical protein